MDLSCVRVAEGVHESLEIVLFMRVEEQMPMIGHHYKGDDVDRDFLVGMSGCIDEQLVVLSGFKNCESPHCTIEAVVWHFCNSNTSKARYVSSVFCVPIFLSSVSCGD